jgi:NADH-quinone oxidoreductase subunit A
LALLEAAEQPYWPLGLYFVLVVVLAAGMIAFSYILGERHRERATDTPYESGMLPTGGARLRFPVDFYLVAMFFVIFDLESVFLFVWAVAVRDVGWAGYVEVLVFIGVLLAALVYLWRNGALDWRSMKPLALTGQASSMGSPNSGADHGTRPIGARSMVIPNDGNDHATHKSGEGK